MAFYHRGAGARDPPAGPERSPPGLHGCQLVCTFSSMAAAPAPCHLVPMASEPHPHSQPPQCPLTGPGLTHHGREPTLTRAPGSVWSCFLPCIPRPAVGSCGGWQGPVHQPVPLEARPHGSPRQPGPGLWQVLPLGSGTGLGCFSPTSGPGLSLL